MSIRLTWPGVAIFALFLHAATPVGAASDTPAEAGDVLGWDHIRWGMTTNEVIAHYGAALTIQQTKTSLGGCSVRYAVPIKLLDEKWIVWLCEEPDSDRISAVNIEIESGQTRHLERFLNELTDAYGPAHAFWGTCHNVRWNGTEKHTWSFKTTKVSLINRDITVPWVVFRYELNTHTPDFGPGVCSHPPVDLRTQGGDAGH